MEPHNFIFVLPEIRKQVTENSSVMLCCDSNLWNPWVESEGTVAHIRVCSVGR